MLSWLGRSIVGREPRRGAELLQRRDVQLNSRYTFGPRTGIAHVQICLGHDEEALDWAGSRDCREPEFRSDLLDVDCSQRHHPRVAR